MQRSGATSGAAPIPLAIGRQTNAPSACSALIVIGAVYQGTGSTRLTGSPIVSTSMTNNAAALAGSTQVPDRDTMPETRIVSALHAKAPSSIWHNGRSGMVRAPEGGARTLHPHRTRSNAIATHS